MTTSPSFSLHLIVLYIYIYIYISLIMKTYQSLHISLKKLGFFPISRNQILSNITARAKHVLKTFKLRTLHLCLYIIRYIHFLCSCFLYKHPSLCEQHFS